jgi:cytochrome c oxidase subunit II
MPFLSRLRRPGTRKAGAAALTVVVAVLIAACSGDHPNSIFHQRTDVNREVDYLFRILIYFGTAVFILVEGILVWALIKYRARPGQPEPEHVHGNTALEITWTVVPLIILVLIGIPTIRTILKTQSAARADALQVEVIGHQWWWEFRYPQYTATIGGKIDTLVTANELYLPVGKTANFSLRSKDVIHSFWVPALSGKRDVVTNHTNYLWYTPDSVGNDAAWNGACVEYCGTSHANMRFKTFTVSQADFDSWAANQLRPAVGTAPPPAPAAAPGAPSGAAPGAASAANAPAVPPGAPAQPPAAPAANAPGASATATPAAQAPLQIAQAGFIAFPREKLPAYVIPQTPTPADLTFDDNLLAKGDAANGAKLMQGAGGCLACHTIRGNPMMVGNIGPDLTHIATRTTIAAGLYPNDAHHVALWIKNARDMKPGVTMYTIGHDQYDPILHAAMKQGLFDPQIADIVAYLMTLK